MTQFIDSVVEPWLWLLADWSLRWAVLIVLLAAVLTVCRPKRTATRSLLCSAALLGGVLIPALPRWGPGFWQTTDSVAPTSLPTDLSRAVDEARAAMRPDQEIVLVPDPVARPDVDAFVAGPAVEPSPVLSLSDQPVRAVLGLRRSVVLLFGGMWALGVLVALVRLSGGWVLLERLRRAATPVAGDAARSFELCCAELRARRRATLVWHPAVNSPITIGPWRPTTLVPPDWSALPASVRRSCMLHEFSHIVRYDDWSTFAMELVRAVFFFHPLVHWLMNRLTREREMLCDEVAVAHGADPREHARMLLDFARRPGWSLLPSLATARLSIPLGDRRTVKVRIDRLLDDSTHRWMAPLPAHRSVLLAITVFTLALGLCSLRVQASGRSAGTVMNDSVGSPAETAPAPFTGSDMVNEPSPGEPSTPNDSDTTTKETDNPPEESQAPDKSKQLAHPITVTGRATDSTGKPVVGAAVYLVSTNGIDAALGNATTDAEGQYKFQDAKLPLKRPERSSPQGTFQVYGIASGYGFAWHGVRFFIPEPRPNIPGGEHNFYLNEPLVMNLTFSPPARLRGRVLDEAGQAIRNVKVQLDHADYLDGTGKENHMNYREFLGIGFLPESSRVTTTDDDGRFELGGLPSEVCFLVRVEHPDYAHLALFAATTDRPLKEHVYTVNGPGQSHSDRHAVSTGELKLSLVSTRRIAMEIVDDQTGKPVEGVTIGAGSGDGPTGTFAQGSSDNAGRVDLRLPPGKYRVVADPPRTSDNVQTYDSLGVAPEAAEQKQTVRLKRGCVLILEAVDAETGEGVPNVNFWCDMDDKPGARTSVQSSTVWVDHPVTDTQGRLRAVVQPGRRRYGVGFGLLPDGYKAVDGERTVDLPAGKTVTVRFELRKDNPPANPQPADGAPDEARKPGVPAPTDGTKVGASAANGRSRRGSQDLPALIDAVKRHEAAAGLIHLKVVETFRPNPELSPKERREYPWADGRKHQQLIEYGRNAPINAWYHKETFLVNDRREQQYDKYSDGNRLMTVHDVRPTPPSVTIGKPGDGVTTLPAVNPLYGVFPFSWRGKLLSSVLANQQGVQLEWDSGDAKLTFLFQYGETDFHSHKFVVWLSRAHAWHPARVQRYMRSSDSTFFDEWKVSKFDKSGDVWYASEGGHDWYDPGRVGAKMAYTVEFRVLEFEAGQSLPLDAFRYRIPDGAQVVDQQTGQRSIQGQGPVVEPTPPTEKKDFTFTVVDVHKRPIRGAVIEIRTKKSSSKDKPLRASETDETGRVVFRDVPKDDLWFKLNHPNYRPASLVVGDTMLEVTWCLAPKTRGVVRDDAGRPVSEVVVTYSIAFHHDGVPRPETLGIRPDHDRTGPDGRFEASCELTLRGPRPSFLVAFDDEGTRMAIRLVPAEQLELPQELQLQPTCLVRATLELEGGDPRELPHFMVSWTDPEGRAFTPGIGVDTEAEAGRLRGQVIGRVPPGVYQLQVGKTAQSQAVSIPFEVKSGTRELDLGTHELRISTLAALRGQPAPELAVHAWRPGEPKRLTDLRGKVVVLDFWGYWCVPCLEQMPALMAIAEKFRDQPVVWVAVHTPNVKDFQELDDKLAAVRERLWRGQPLPFATIIDAPDEQDEQHGATATRYGIQLWPTLVVIDQNGNVVDTVAKERLEETLRRLLGR